LGDRVHRFVCYSVDHDSYQTTTLGRVSHRDGGWWSCKRQLVRH